MEDEEKKAAAVDRFYRTLAFDLEKGVERVELEVESPPGP